jgi:hypothetical protein
MAHLGRRELGAVLGAESTALACRRHLGAGLGAVTQALLHLPPSKTWDVEGSLDRPPHDRVRGPFLAAAILARVSGLRGFPGRPFLAADILARASGL